MSTDWRNFFTSERRVLRTRLALEECVARLAAGLTSAWAVFPEPNKPFRGHVSARGFRVRRAIFYWNAFQTEAIGEFSTMPDGTRIALRVGMARSTIIALAIWSGAVVVVAATAVGIVISKHVADAKSIGAAAVAALLLIGFEVAVVSIGRWLARREEDSLLRLLSEVWQSEEVSGGYSVT